MKDPKELLLSIQSVIKNRNGSVLARQLILKSDHFDTGIESRLDFGLHGAPNFRMADLDIFGVAQPTYSGILTILNLLQLSKGSKKIVYWFCAREEPLIYINRKPFVIRDIHSPYENIKTYQGISAERLEAMEDRLKLDVKKELAKWNNLILVHEEVEQGKIVPMWTAVTDLQTPKELFNGLNSKGIQIHYVRIPISPEQAPEDHYIDDYVDIIKKCEFGDPLVFNCGMGVGRTTFAMVVAMILRRSQILNNTNIDPLIVPDNVPQTGSKTMLRLVQMLERGLNKSTSAIAWTLERGRLIDDLQNAVLGNYQCILQQVGILSNGQNDKRFLDEIIDRCDLLQNIREIILMYRIRCYVNGSGSNLSKAVGCLERYFFLLAFCSYVSENCETGFNLIFSDWLKEISSILGKMRGEGSKLHLFRPIEDLSSLVDVGELSGWGSTVSRPLANEFEQHVLKSRNGAVLVSHSILKIDQWTKPSEKDGIEGAANFRKVPNFRIYGVAQPTLGGMKNVIKAIDEKSDMVEELVWINLREEPLIYINGVPYVLRDQYLTVRNSNTYAGITPSRLETFENRLKEDVQQEISMYKNRILLHGESEDGHIIPIWEDCLPDAVSTIKEVIQVIQKEEKDELLDLESARASSLRIEYFRVPITAENPPDLIDIDLLLRIMTRVSLEKTSIVLNCQMGSGRSTTGTASLIMHWLNGTIPEWRVVDKHRKNYQVTHSLLRVIRNGLECKRIVDEVIDDCGAKINLRTTIEESRLAAETCTDEVQKKRIVEKGLVLLKRYFLLIVFQSFLNQTTAESSEQMTNFSIWYSKHPELESIHQELNSADILALTPVDDLVPGDGLALTNEVIDVVNGRQGAVVAQGTIIKYDMFPGSQKMSLPDKIEGGPNFRRISLSAVRLQGIGHNLSRVPSGDISNLGSSGAQFVNLYLVTSRNSQYTRPSFDADPNQAYLYGIAMPTKDAIRRVLQKVGGATPENRRVLWTSLREEPVIYVNGRPYVLRLFPEPLKNLEATGIARERVELMETQMKSDILAEIKKFGGRVLLHEEHVEGTNFTIVPIWETVKEEDVQTPLEVYKSIQDEGYSVNYLRIPITDEQSPIPKVVDQLVDRVLGMTPGTDVIFNCQQGRGRTTTAMVITTLLQMILGNKGLVGGLSSPEVSTIVPPSIIDEDVGALTDSVDDIRVRTKAGEWKVVLQLIAVLQYGKLAKKLTDRAIDICDHMQNLRVAVTDYKLRIDAVDIGSKKYNMLYDMGCNYLVRYFYLIAFADYLLEEMSSSSRKGLSSPAISSTEKRRLFSDWLKDRREILNIIRNQSMD